MLVSTKHEGWVETVNFREPCLLSLQKEEKQTGHESAECEARRLKRGKKRIRKPGVLHMCVCVKGQKKRGGSSRQPHRVAVRE